MTLDFDKIKLYLQSRICYYDFCAKEYKNNDDAVRAQMCRIILVELESAGRVDLAIDRLKGFIPKGKI